MAQLVQDEACLLEADQLEQVHVVIESQAKAILPGDVQASELFCIVDFDTAGYPSNSLLFLHLGLALL